MYSKERVAVMLFAAHNDWVLTALRSSLSREAKERLEYFQLHPMAGWQLLGPVEQENYRVLVESLDGKIAHLAGAV